jgi:hypothetical protein
MQRKHTILAGTLLVAIVLSATPARGEGSGIITGSIYAGSIHARTITYDKIALGTLTANEIAVHSLTADRLDVSYLSALTADLGTITAGTITGALIRTGTGARAQMDGTSLKSIDASDNVLVEMDGSGVRITPDTTFQVARMYGFGGSLIGVGYVTSPYNALGVYTDDDIQFVKYSGGVAWGMTMADKSLYPAGNDYSIGTVANPYAGFYGATYHAKVGATTYDGMTKDCGGGSEFVQDIVVKGGIVTDVNCATPAPAPASELAALKARVSELETLVARLLADKPR